MTVTSVREKGNARSAKDGLGERSYEREFLVRTSDKTDSADVAASGVGVPRIGEAFPTDTGAVCVDRTAKQVPEAPTAWNVTASSSSARQLALNPLDDPVVITLSAENYQRPAIYDVYGKAILNSAGDWFDPPPQMDDSRFVATVKKNLASAPPWILEYQDAVNNAAFNILGLTIATGVAKLSDLAFSERQERNDVFFRQMSFKLHFRQEGWRLAILDQGHRRLGDYSKGEDPTKRYRIVNSGDQTDSDTLVLLDGDGHPLEDPRPETAVFIEHQVYVEKDFGVLPLS